MNYRTTESENSRTFERLLQRIDSRGRFLRAWDLKGGVSAQVTAIEFELPAGHLRRMVVRRHGDVDLERNPRIAADEFRLLQMVQSAGVPVPTPYLVDESGEVFPTPYLVIEYIEGEPEFAPTNLDDLIHQLAVQLARIHRIQERRSDLGFLPRLEEMCAEQLAATPENLDQSIDEGRIRAALESAWPLTQRNEAVLLHGDYWPGNVLWKDGRLLAIIDWEDAVRGDPLVDLANCRLEILWAFGLEGMHRFTEEYRSAAQPDIADLPFWDLWAALRPAGKLAEWAADAAAEQTMRAGHRLFVAQAFERLALR